MSRLIIFPWMKRNEVERVYKELYSDNPALQKHAIGRITVWKSRALHKLPLALESTAAFVSANLEFQRAALSDNHDLHLRNIYSMALLRFINHITEKGQSKPYAQPVHRLAGELGVPEWIVELRHEATHGSLPSLTILRAATKWSLQWLKTEFWEVQIVGGSPCSEKRDTQTDLLRDMLVTFQQQRFQAINEKTTGQPADIDDKLLDDIEMMFLELGSEVCPILAADGYLVCTEDQLTSLGYNHTDILKNGLFLPPKITQFWKLILLLLQKHNLVTSLLLHMVSVVTEEKSLRNKILYGWMFTIIQQNNPKKTSRKSSFPLPYKQLLDLGIQVHSVYSTELLDLLLSRVDTKYLSESRVRQLKQLMSTYFTDEVVIHVDRNNDPVHSVTDEVVVQVRQLMSPYFTDEVDMHVDSNIDPVPITDIEHSHQQLQSRNRWSVCTESVDWSTCPLGILPNQSIGYKTLELGCNEEDMEDDADDAGDDLINTTEDIPDLASEDQFVADLWSNDTIQSVSSQINVF